MRSFYTEKELGLKKRGNNGLTSKYLYPITRGLNSAKPEKYTCGDKNCGQHDLFVGKTSKSII
ncbi:MAG: hypothetical protein LBD59_00860 [Prevotellaceae bacterium]|jgi:hypothetical protein|nr:hypothetical protein [Prevotellaceae bacterium]